MSLQRSSSTMTNLTGTCTTAAKQEVNYHGARRNALGDIFEDVDNSLVSQLCRKCSFRANAQTTITCSSSSGASHGSKRLSAPCRVSAASTDTTDRAHFASCCGADLDNTGLQEMKLNNGPTHVQSSDTGSCRREQLDFYQPEGNSENSQANAGQLNGSVTSQKKRKSEKKSSSHGDFAFSNQKNNFRSMAGFRPKDCAKRSMVC